MKSIAIFPSNAELGLDLHQGFVALFDGETGATRAIMNAGGITAVRTAAVSGVATRLLAREHGGTLAILGAGIQGKSHLEAMRAVRDFDRVVAWSRTPGRAAAELDDVEELATAEAAVRAADVIVTATSAAEPILNREWLKPGVHINAVGSSIPTTRELDTATMRDASLFVDRRESTVNEAGDFLIPQREGVIGPEHIRAEIGEVLIGTAPGRQSDDELTVFKSLGLAVEDLAAAEHVLRRRRSRRRRHDGLAVIPIAEIRRAREVLEGTAIRTPLVRLDVDSDAEIWLKLEVLQPVRSFKIRGAGNAILQATDAELAAGVLHGERRQHGAGRRVRRPPARRARDDRRPRPRAADEDRRDRALRRPRDQGAVRGVVAGARHGPLRRGAPACSCTRSTTTG